MAWPGRLVTLAAFVLTARLAAATPEDPTEHAKLLFAHAETLYTLERYDEALLEYERAFELKPLPGFLYNIAQCHRQLGHFAKAAHFYRTYVERAPRAPNRELVHTLVEEMDRLVATVPTTTTTTVTRTRPTVVASTNPLRPDLTVTTVDGKTTGTSPPVYKAWWFWTVGGVLVGGAAIGVGVGVGVGGSQAGPRGTLGTIDVGP